MSPVDFCYKLAGNLPPRKTGGKQKVDQKEQAQHTQQKKEHSQKKLTVSGKEKVTRPQTKDGAKENKQKKKEKKKKKTPKSALASQKTNIFDIARLRSTLPTGPRGKRKATTTQAKFKPRAMTPAGNGLHEGRLGWGQNLPDYCTEVILGPGCFSRKKGDHALEPDYVVSNITPHARRRMKERGVKPSAVYRSSKSVGIKNHNGIVRTVVPEAWAAGAAQYLETPSCQSRQGNKP